jgi:uncharacterized protein involved in exopolysaccharide biosynthesis/Mrp family chromosome partitioning ATPase
MDIPVDHAPAAVAHRSPDTMQLSHILRLLRRRFWMIAATAVAGALGACVIAATMPKSYTSTALLALEGNRIGIPQLQGALRDPDSPDQMPVLRTEMQALTAPEIVEQAALQLDLPKNPEFNSDLRPPSLFGRVFGAFQSLMPKPAPLPAAEAGAVSPGARDPNEGVVKAAAQALHMFQDNRSLVIEASFTAHDPELAARFVNTLIADYLSARSKFRDSTNAGASAEMADRIAQVRASLDAIEQKMRELRSASGAVGLRAGTVGQQQLEELATAADRATVERAQAEADWQRASAAARTGDSAALASVLGSPTISRLRDQEAQATRRIADLSTSHGDNYPGLRGAQSDLAATRAQVAIETQRIVASLGAQLQVAQAHEADVKRQLEQARIAAVSSQNTEAELTQLDADAASQRLVYQTLLQQAQQTTAPSGKEGVDLPGVRLISAATPSNFASAPNMKLAGAIGFVGGGVLGCLFAFLRQQSEDGFADARTLEEAGGVTAAGVLPRTALGRRARLLSRVAAAPGGPEADAMRAMRARLRGLGRSVRNVTFTSVGLSGEDLATVAAAFARVAAADGERVLLVEGDLAQPALGSVLGLPDGGFARALRERGDWRDAVQADPEAPLDVLSCGSASDDALTLVGAVAFQNMLMEARDDYGLVVVAACAAEQAGARTLAQRSDATVVVVDGRRARRADVRSQAERLGMLSRTPLLGMLVART